MSFIINFNKIYDVKILQPILTIFEKSPIYYLFWLVKFLTYTYL